MTDLDRQTFLQFGKHASATDFTSTPGTLYALTPESADFRPLGTSVIERDLMASDNRNFFSAVGIKELTQRPLVMEVKGLSSGTVAARNRLTDSDMGAILDVVCGADGIDALSTDATTSSVSGASLTLSLGTPYTVGQAISVNVGAAGVEFREPRAIVGNVITMDRALVGTMAISTPVRRACTWRYNPSNTEHVHGYFNAEGQGWRRTYTGCMSSGTFNFPDAGKCTFSTSWDFDDFQNQAPTSPSFVAPNGGAPIVAVNSTFHVGASRFIASGASLDLGLEYQRRETSAGINGGLGFKVTRKKPVFRCNVYGPGLAALNEMLENSGTPSVRDVAGTALVGGSLRTSYDVAFQVGNANGRGMYIVMPAAELRGRVVEQNGMHMVALECVANSPGAGGDVLRIHLF
jgi:hypothetical protein